MFSPIKKEFNNNNTFIYFEIDNFSDDLKKHLNRRISYLSDATDSDLRSVKKQIGKAVIEKGSGKIKIGMIAEFFTQLYLDNEGFESKYYFLNLEDDSYKKGFDGFFQKDSINWIMESKSGDFKKSKHYLKVRLAYNDLKNKISGKAENNPWQNALIHAKLRNPNDSLLEKLRELKNEYENEKFHDIENFYIIPSGTIFFQNQSMDIDIDDLITKVKKITDDFSLKNSIIICVSNKSAQNFLDYLES